MTKIEEAENYLNKAEEAEKTKDYDAAKINYEKTIELTDKYYSSSGFHFSVLRNEDSNEEIQEYTTSNESEFPLADVYLRYAYLLADKFNEYENAKDYAEKTIELDTDNQFVYYQLAMLFAEQFKDYEKAKEFCEKAIELNSNFTDAYYYLALLSRELNENEKAKQYFAKYTELTKVPEIDYVKKYSKKIKAVNSVSIKDYFSIKDIEIENLKDKKEIYFLGENGDGKTILLQAIYFSFQQYYIKNYADKALVGEATEALSQNKELILKATDSNDTEFNFWDLSFAENIFAYGVNRSRTQGKKDKYNFMTLFSNEIELNDPIEWLKDLDHYEKSGDFSQIPLVEAIKILKDILDNNVEIEVSHKGVKFIERGTNLNFEQLSDGYKNVLIWVSDLIVKLSGTQIGAKKSDDFEGVVLIDEIDLHLHPKWCYSIVKKLRTWFPKIQWLITTHSPDVIRGAGENSVFYKLYKDIDKKTGNKIVKISEPYEISEFQDSMLNVIATSPLFDLPHARMENYRNGNLETDNDYWYAKIHSQVRNDIKEMKIAGKIHLSKKDINFMIKKAVEKYSQDD